MTNEQIADFVTREQISPAMTGDDFRAARRKLGLTGKGMARALRMGVHGWQTISAWENGKNEIPGPAQVAIESLLALANR